MGPAANTLKRHAKAAFFRVHEIGARCGVIILPKHYYVPIPDLRDLRRTRTRWNQRSSLAGVAVDLDAQVRFLQRVVQPYEAEYRGNQAFKTATEGAFGPGFGYIEAQALYGFVRGTKPGRIIEVGSGVSTHCMMEALARNGAEAKPGVITCIEPYPRPWLRTAPVALLETKVEDVDLGLFDQLRAGDLLFVDSSHTVRVGGDVVRIVLEILPRLRDGVHVHFHDVFLPYHFQRDVDRSLYHWMETALLHAYLIGNERVTISLCLSQLHYDRPSELQDTFPEYLPEGGSNGLRAEPASGGHFPSSLYLTIRSADGADQPA